jgi:hypothetical protein
MQRRKEDKIRLGRNFYRFLLKSLLKDHCEKALPLIPLATQSLGVKASWALLAGKKPIRSYIMLIYTKK